MLYKGERLIVALSFSLIVSAALSLLSIGTASAQSINRTIIRAGQMVKKDATADSSNAADSLSTDFVAAVDSLANNNIAESNIAHSSGGIFSTQHSEELSGDDVASVDLAAKSEKSRKKLLDDKNKLFSDSMSLSAMGWKALAMPGYGQIYNKQYWKLPILYGTLGAGLTMFFRENKIYKPLKEEYDVLSIDLYRSEELNSVQAAMIRSNTRRQLYLGATVASFLYFLGDAVMNYSTNDVSDIKRATTLAMICPGAGQVYNKSYWKVPIVIGGFGTLIYVIDWNNRGYQRFKTAYNLTYAYENGEYETPVDEFGGAYSSTYMKSLRQQYRRSRDLSIIMLAGLYILQIVDAHVDAHFKSFDISDNLSLSVEPTVSNVYSPASGRTNASYGFSIAARF
ncbi:MAG: DUF5683 domain-containing protein [Rikenellaceae bacterium]